MRCYLRTLTLLLSFQIRQKSQRLTFTFYANWVNVVQSRPCHTFFLVWGEEIKSWCWCWWYLESPLAYFVESRRRESNHPKCTTQLHLPLLLLRTDEHLSLSLSLSLLLPPQKLSINVEHCRRNKQESLLPRA